VELKDLSKQIDNLVALAQTALFKVDRAGAR